MAEPVPPRHRRRERRRAPAEAPRDYAAPAAEPPVEAPPPARPKKPRRDDAERGLRGIVGTGPSQVDTVAAMRARDAARPTPEDLAAAERDVVVVRRHYVPPDALPGPR